MPAMRRFLLACIPVLANVGLQVSGYQSLPLAITLWCIAAGLGIWAVVTWEPVVQWRRRGRARQAPADVGAYDFQANSETLARFFVEVVPPINQASNDIAAIHARYEPQYPTSNPQVRQRVSIAEAKEMNASLDRIEQYMPRLREITDFTAQCFVGIDEYAARPPETGWTREELKLFRNAVAGLVNLMNRELGNIDRFRHFMDSRRGDSVEMNAASDKGIALSTRLSDSYGAIRVACEKAVATADRFLADPPY